MSKYNFARRLKRIVAEECEIVKAESIIAQKSAKYCEKLSVIKTILVKQEQELNKYRNNLQTLVHDNETLRKLKLEQEDQLTVLLQKLDELELEYNRIVQRQVEQSLAAQIQMECFRSIKVATQTYINLKALPQLIQGVTVTEKDTSSEWNPFCIETSKHTQKEVEDIIWREPGNESVLKQTWETLIFGDILSDAKTSTDMDTSNVTTTGACGKKSTLQQLT